jgi:5'/3'-nucleotidase SurE
MRILVANDDGIYSPGIATLARAATKFGDVRVVAPDVEQSSAGHAITASRPVRFRRTRIFDEIEAYRVDGTPADCVALGAYHWDHVDVVLSGINLGLNLGNSTWHSGTLAAAKQAVLLGIRGVALSAPVTDETTDLHGPRTVARAGSRKAPSSRGATARQRQLPEGAARRLLDRAGRRPVQRQGRPGHRSDGSRALLVHGHSA